MISRIKKNLLLIILALALTGTLVYAHCLKDVSYDIVARAYQFEKRDSFYLIYGEKGTETWNTLFSLLTYSRDLVKNAQTLILTVATYSKQDCFPWDDLEMQTLNGGGKIRIIHGSDFIYPVPEEGSFVGFNYEKARHVFNISPEQYAHVIIAIEE